MATSNPTRNRYCLFRHGESESNARDVINSLPAEALAGGGLTENGTRQVRASAERLRQIPEAAAGAVVVSSDFLRARQTAELVVAVLGADQPVLDARLRERGCAPLHGRPSAEFRGAVWAADARGETAPGCEGVSEVASRLGAVVRACETGWAGQLVVLVTHCDPARIFLAHWLGEPLSSHFERGAIPTAGWHLLPPEPCAERGGHPCPATS